MHPALAWVLRWVFQKCSVLLLLSAVGAGKPALSLPGLLDLTVSVSGLKAWRGGGRTALSLDAVCSPKSWFCKWLKLSWETPFTTLPMWIVFFCPDVPCQWQWMHNLVQLFDWICELLWGNLMSVYEKEAREEVSTSTCPPVVPVSLTCTPFPELSGFCCL